MTGPMIWVVRILAVVFILIFFHLLFRTNPPIEAIIFLAVIIAVGSGLWTRAERMRGNYLREESPNKNIPPNVSASGSAMHSSQPERIVERHYNKQGVFGRRAEHLVLVLAAICTILAFIRSCIK